MSASPDPSPSSSAPAGLHRTHPHPHAHAHHHHNLHLSTPPPPPHPPTPAGPLAVTPHQQALAPYSAPPPSPASATPRDYRKGNWTLHETLVLITAKRLDDDRRAGGGVSGISPSSSSSPAASLPRSAEQRWKWVENYCWGQGCLRSQNQCNDKWDNLLRDYKKVRDFHSRISSSANSVVPSGSGAASAAAAGAPLPASYWAMERHERKERNLPTNLAPEVYDALCDVLSRRAARRGGSAVAPSPAPPLALPAPTLHPPPASPPKPLLSQQQRILHHHPPLLQLPPPPPPVAAVAPPLPPAMTTTTTTTASVSEDEMTGSSDDSGSSSGPSGGGGRDEPNAKRQRRRGRVSGGGERGRLGSSVVRSATVLARTMAACEEKRERRHRELLELEERRLRLESERTEARRQGFAGLISAVHSLSGAIHALVSDHSHGRSGDSSR